MKKLEFILLFAFLFAGTRISAFATDYYTTAAGDWQSSAIWSTDPMGTGVLWSTLTIVAGDVIHINDNTTINGSDVVISVDVTIIIDAQLSIDKKLRLTANSVINVTSNGSIVATGGGNSTKISFGSNGNVVWDGNDPPLVGPGSLDKDSNGSLPVDLLSFSGKVLYRSVLLSWATASEENFDYFSIERSADGLNFKEIAQVSGAGFSMTRMDYSYNDEFPLQGRSYYRLRSIDFDGYTEIFDYVMVNVEDAKNKFSIYPNPIENSSFKVQTNFAIEEPVQLLVYNNMGMVEQTFQLNDWLATYTLAELQPGTYMFKLISNEEVLVQRVLIR